MALSAYAPVRRVQLVPRLARLARSWRVCAGFTSIFALNALVVVYVSKEASWARRQAVTIVAELESETAIALVVIRTKARPAIGVAQREALPCVGRLAVFLVPYEARFARFRTSARAR